MLRECDYSQALLEQVNQAISDKTPLVIQGSNSKAFLGRPVTGQTLDVRCHRGIVNYDPTELVITARAGTPLVAIEAALESAGQMLPCEPPHYGEEATWGGMVACGLAGPRRPWSGSVRDFVLGTRRGCGRFPGLLYHSSPHCWRYILGLTAPSDNFIRRSLYHLM